MEMEVKRIVKLARTAQRWGTICEERKEDDDSILVFLGLLLNIADLLCYLLQSTLEIRIRCLQLCVYG